MSVRSQDASLSLWQNSNSVDWWPLKAPLRCSGSHLTFGQCAGIITGSVFCHLLYTLHAAS